MKILVDLDSAVPVYEQVRVQLTAYIDAEILSPGDRLPSIRQLANDLGVATNTVQRTYRELEIQGVIHTRGRHGTTVMAKPASDTQDVPTPAMQRAAERLAHEVFTSGGGIDDVIRLARSAFLNLRDSKSIGGNQ